MATIVKAPQHLSAKDKKARTTVFLAGAFEEGDGGADQPRSWRDDVIAALDDLDITIYDPRNERWSALEAGSPGQRGAFEWQCATAYDADVVMVWVPDGRRAPTALMILGYLAAKRGNAKRGSSVVVGGNGWDGLVQVFAQNSRLFPMGDDLAEVVRVTRIQVEEVLAAKGTG